MCIEIEDQIQNPLRFFGIKRVSENEEHLYYHYYLLRNPFHASKIGVLFFKVYFLFCFHLLLMTYPTLGEKD